MARVREFNEPEAKEDRIRWSTAGTRKWLTIYLRGHGIPPQVRSQSERARGVTEGQHSQAEKSEVQQA